MNVLPAWLQSRCGWSREASRRPAARLGVIVLLPLVAMSLGGCVIMHEQDGEGRSATYASLGGKGAYRKGFGVMHHHEKSFRDATVAATALAAGYYGAATARATEATNQLALKEATKQAAAKETTRRAAIEANAAAHGQAISAELPGVVPAAAPPPITP